MRHLATLSILLLCAASAPAAETPTFGNGATLQTAQEHVDAGIRSRAQFDEKTHELVIDSSLQAPAVGTPAMLDVQWGSGHGGTLTFVRFSISAKTTSIEHIAYDAEGRSDPASWSARRADVPTSAVAPLVQLARAESPTRASLRRRPDSNAGVSVGGSTADFFVLARITAADGRQVLEREYCGYPGGRASLNYAGMLVVEKAVRTYLDGISTWTAVAPEALRTTHFDAAFAANADLMFRDFHWWVMERSVEALGVFGTEASLPTLRRLDAEYKNPQPRQRVKIRNALARPDHYLAGEPKPIPEKPIPEKPIAEKVDREKPATDDPKSSK